MTALRFLLLAFALTALAACSGQPKKTQPVPVSKGSSTSSDRVNPCGGSAVNPCASQPINNPCTGPVNPCAVEPPVNPCNPDDGRANPGDDNTRPAPDAETP